MDIVGGRREGSKVFRFYVAPGSDKEEAETQTDRQTVEISCHEMQSRSCRSLSFFSVFHSLKETPLRKSWGGSAGGDSGPKLAAPFRLSVCLIGLISCDCWTSKDSAD